MPAGKLEFTSKVSLTNDQKLQYGPSFKELEVLVQPQTAHRLYLKITPEGQQRWQVPETLVPRLVQRNNTRVFWPVTTAAC